MNEHMEMLELQCAAPGCTRTARIWSRDISTFTDNPLPVGWRRVLVDVFACPWHYPIETASVTSTRGWIEITS